MYNIGDVVKIREDLIVGEWYYDESNNRSDSVNDDMQTFLGETATIVGLSSNGGYRINLDEGRWNWTFHMFNGKVKGNASPFQMWENSISQ